MFLPSPFHSLHSGFGWQNGAHGGAGKLLRLARGINDLINKTNQPEKHTTLLSPMQSGTNV
jgi:hypothetical protein